MTISKDQGEKKILEDYNVKANTNSWKLSLYPVNFQNKINITPKIIKSNENMIFGLLEDNNNIVWYGTLDGVKRIKEGE